MMIYIKRVVLGRNKRESYHTANIHIFFIFLLSIFLLCPALSVEADYQRNISLTAGPNDLDSASIGHISIPDRVIIKDIGLEGSFGRVLFRDQRLYDDIQDTWTNWDSPLKKDPGIFALSPGFEVYASGDVRGSGSGVKDGNLVFTPMNDSAHYLILTNSLSNETVTVSVTVVVQEFIDSQVDWSGVCIAIFFILLIIGLVFVFRKGKKIPEVKGSRRDAAIYYHSARPAQERIKQQRDKMLGKK